MTMEIGGEDWNVTPAVWEVFDEWYGDKSYRHAGFVAEIEAAVRAQVVADLRAKATRDWPGIGGFLEDIIAVVIGGVDGEPQ
ncbi:hypothetical protein ACFRCI_23600 [Streptomyces sp. NPDC056638]|uniref:hypothetical protein n=1 Tax=Streptomyces sp. NPDC056638 TaxID=3345887 RepID=UPI0036AE70A3